MAGIDSIMRILLFVCAVLWPSLVFAQPIPAVNSGVRVLCQSGAPVALTGSVSETNLAVCQVPPLGPNSSLWVSVLYSNNNDANAKSGKIRFSATSGDVSGGVPCLAVSATTQVSGNYMV